MTTHSIKLDLDKTLQLPPPTITARQGDTQCGITAMVTDHGAPATLTGYTAKFQAAKPDGTYAEQAAQINGSTVTVELDPQFLAAAGLIRTAYFRFFEGTAEKESTQNMCIRVIHDAEGEAPDFSTSYIPTVDQLVEDATEDDRRYLDMKRYDLVVVVRSYTYTKENVLFQFTESRHRPDCFRFVEVAQRKKI